MGEALVGSLRSAMAENDPIVQRLDVCITQKLEDDGLLYLLQSPLRPPNRPYDVEYSEDVRFKVGLLKSEVQHSVASLQLTPLRRLLTLRAPPFCVCAAETGEARD